MGTLIFCYILALLLFYKFLGRQKHYFAPNGRKKYKNMKLMWPFLLGACFFLKED